MQVGALTLVACTLTSVLGFLPVIPLGPAPDATPPRLLVLILGRMHLAVRVGFWDVSKFTVFTCSPRST